MQLGDGRRLRLVPRARLRFDARAGRAMLVYPERGLLLNATAAAVCELLDGTRTAVEIVAQLLQRYSDADPVRLEDEVKSFLQQLSERALVDSAP
jgi:coenzyme PQQ biosynthesis protein PqqD